MSNNNIKMGVSVEDATHVKVGGRLERITSKYGIRDNGYGYPAYAKPSEGGFGVRTESGRIVSMWEAQAYGKEESTKPE